MGSYRSDFVDRFGSVALRHAGVVGADEEGDEASGHLTLVAPGVAGTVLDHGVARPEQYLGAVVELETLDPEHANPVAAWRAMGAPSSPTREQTVLLDAAARATRRESVVVPADGVLRVTGPGRGTLANVDGNAAVTLLFPPLEQHGYALLVDGTGAIDGEDVVYKNFVHMGIAVGGPNGLVVPVLRNADRMGFAEIEKTIGQFGKRARDGQLKLEELAGGFEFGGHVG